MLFYDSVCWIVILSVVFENTFFALFFEEYFNGHQILARYFSPFIVLIVSSVKNQLSFLWLSHISSIFLSTFNILHLLLIRRCPQIASFVYIWLRITIFLNLWADILTKIDKLSASSTLNIIPYSLSPFFLGLQLYTIRLLGTVLLSLRLCSFNHILFFLYI